MAVSSGAFVSDAEVREDLLLRIMNFVEDSGTTLASASQTLYLSGESRLKRDKIDSKKATEGSASGQNSTDASQSESASRSQKPEAGKNVD